jgi:hypothetical protein
MRWGVTPSSGPASQASGSALNSVPAARGRRGEAGVAYGDQAALQPGLVDRGVASGAEGDADAPGLGRLEHGHIGRLLAVVDDEDRPRRGGETQQRKLEARGEAVEPGRRGLPLALGAQHRNETEVHDRQVRIGHRGDQLIE